jgi:hypothetical protein
MILQSEVSTENKHVLRKLFLVIFILLIGGAIGAAVTSYFSLLSSVAKCLPSVTVKEEGKNTKESYQAGFDAARKLVEESSIGQVFRSPDEVRAVGGTVTAISGNKILIHLNSSNPFDDPKLLDRTIVIGDDTIITGVVSSVDVNNVKMPITYMKEDATASDIKIGTYISALTDDDVRSVKEFMPNQIYVLKLK